MALRSLLPGLREVFGQVGGLSVIASASFIRPNDAVIYAVGDLIANNTVAGNVVPLALPVAFANDRTGLIRKLRLKVNDPAWKAGIIRCHLFQNSPTVNVGDNGALNAAETYGFTESEYLGACDITLAKQTSDNFAKGFGVCVAAEGQEWNFAPAAGTQTIYALLEARSAVTPAAQKTFTLSAEVWQN